jgi:hypothetical protein
METCLHPHQNRVPLCDACYAALTDAQRHYVCVATEAKAQGLPVTIRSPFGEPKQGALFTESKALEALG